MSSPGFRVEDHEILFPLHHLRQILERHVGARAGVVEASIGVLLDDRRLGRLGHVVFRARGCAPVRLAHRRLPLGGPVPDGVHPPTASHDKPIPGADTTVLSRTHTRLRFWTYDQFMIALASSLSHG